jgi:hypothetical protein
MISRVNCENSEVRLALNPQNASSTVKPEMAFVPLPPLPLDGEVGGLRADLNSRVAAP